MMKNSILVLLWISFLSAQYDQDARMLGLSGAYTNIAEGYSSVGINPANLSYGTDFSMNLGSINASFWNSALSLSVINELNGANMIDSTSIHYYDKSRLDDLFDEKGLLLNSEFNLPLPVLNFSINNWAVTSTNHIYTEIGIPTLLLDFLFFGNTINEKMNFELPLSIQSVQETGLTYSNKFKSLHIGATVKHLLGYYYNGVDMIDSAFFLTDTSSFQGKGGFLLKQGIGGNGFGLDLGILTTPFLDGWQVGMSITNIFGNIEWKQDSYFRSLLEDSIQGALPEEMQLRPLEYYYYYFTMDSINAISLSNEKFEDLLYSDGYRVIEVKTLEQVEGFIYNDSLVVELADSLGFLIPSKDITAKQLGTFSDKPFTTKYPSMFRLGISKKYSDYLVFAMDINTGFSSELGSYDEWRVNFASEITKFKYVPFRFGIGFGGNRGASLSLGTGLWLGKFHFDIGLAYKKGLTINSSKGLDFGMSLSIN